MERYLGYLRTLSLTRGNSAYHEILCSMTLQYDMADLDPFTHTKEDKEKIDNFDFIKEHSSAEGEKIRIDETFCTLVTVGGKFLEKNSFKMVLKKIDEIRRIIRV